jgi:hypothetical protein
MNDEHDEITPELARIYEMERARPRLDDTEADEILGRVLQTIGSPGRTGGDGSEGQSGLTPNGTSASTGPGTVASALARWAPMGIPTLIVGVAIGAALGATLSRSDMDTPAPEARATVALPPAPDTTRENDVEVRTPEVAADASTATARVAREVDAAAPLEARMTSDRDLTAERRLIDAARAALARGAWDAALASVRTHATRYPSRCPRGGTRGRACASAGGCRTLGTKRTRARASSVTAFRIVSSEAPFSARRSLTTYKETPHETFDGGAPDRARMARGLRRAKCTGRGQPRDAGRRRGGHRLGDDGCRRGGARRRIRRVGDRRWVD